MARRPSSVPLQLRAPAVAAPAQDQRAPLALGIMKGRAERQDREHAAAEQLLVTADAYSRLLHAKDEELKRVQAKVALYEKSMATAGPGRRALRTSSAQVVGAVGPGTNPADESDWGALNQGTRPLSALFVRRAIPRDGPAPRPRSAAARTAAQDLGRRASLKLQELGSSREDTGASAAASRSVDSIWDLGDKAGLHVENSKLKQTIRELRAQLQARDGAVGQARAAAQLADAAARKGLEREASAAREGLEGEVARLKMEKRRDWEKICGLQAIVDSFDKKANTKAESLTESLDVLYMTDDALEAKFIQLADKQADGSPVISKEGFCKALAAFNVAMTPAEADEAFSIMDYNKDEYITFQEFHSCTKTKTQLEMLLSTQPILRALANVMVAVAGGSKDPLSAYVNLSDEDIGAAVARFEPALKKIIRRHISTLKRAEEEGVAATADGTQSNDKFAFPIKGGDLDNFNAGITERVGYPHPHVAEGMKIEHTAMGDSDMEFTTGNYGITTTPRREYELVMSGGTGTDLTADDLKGRGSVRVLRPLSWYGEFDKTGTLITKDGESIVSTTPEVVVKACLRLEEVKVLILYTGPLYWIWNTVLRGKEATPPNQLEVWERCSKHRNFYSSSLHILGSAIKKIQQSGVGLKEDMMLYRGLSGGKLPEQMFKPDQCGRLGMAEFGMSSTTSKLAVAIDYSGANAGKMATVLAVRTTQVDSAACLTDFSQYPHEKEFLWLALSYVQLIRGKEEMIVTEQGQLVRILHVTINANARTLTIEQLEEQRKNIVVPMLNLLHSAVCQRLDQMASTEEFQERLQRDWQPDLFGPGKKNDFLQRFKDEALERIKLFADKPPAWFLDNDNLGQAVAGGLALSKLAEDKLTLWLHDKKLQLTRFSPPRGEDYVNFEAAHGFLMARQQQQLSGALGRNDHDTVARLALEISDALGFVHGATPEELERVDYFSGERPLLIQCFLGDNENLTLLLQARANPNAVCSSTGKPALLCVAEMGYTDVVATLLRFKANVHDTDKRGQTALHLAARSGHVDIVELLLKGGAVIERCDKLNWRPMHWAAKRGHVGVVNVLMSANADVNAAGETQTTPLHYAARHGHVGVLEALAQDQKLSLSLLNKDRKSALDVVREARDHSLKNLSSDQMESKREDDFLLWIEFDTFAELPNKRMSKRMVVEALAALHVIRDEARIDELLARIDANSDGEIDFEEFRLIVYEEFMQMLERM